MAQRGFWRELKRRHVYRVAAAYAIVGWLLIQVVTQVFPIFHFPDWVDQAIVLLILVGFPIALVLAWAFDATPHGIVATDAQDNEPNPSARRRSRRAGIAVGLIGVLVAAIAGDAYWHFGRSAASRVEVAGVARSHNAAICRSAPCARPAVETQARSPELPASTQAASAQAIPAKSIAVLPFQNLSGDPKQVYFSDGVTEEILNALAQIPDLKVAGRTSAFQFASKSEDVRKVGAILGVATVLEGSVQKAGDEVRITAQLIDTRTGYQLWSEQYDRKLTNIFAVEDDISNAIMGKLKVQWNGAQPLVAQNVIDPRAHDFYLRGLALLTARGPGLRDAVAAFQNAVKIAPDYAQASGAMAEATALLPDYGLSTMPAAYSSALADARNALSLDPDLASAYVAQGMVYKNQWRWSEADQAFRRALALAPNDAEAVDQYAQFLSVTDQQDRALAEIERAQRLDPLSGIIGLAHGTILDRLHRYHEAATQYASVLAAHPDFALAHADAIDLYITMHRYTDAEQQARALANLADADPGPLLLYVRGVADPSLRPRALHELESSSALAFMRRDPVNHAYALVRLGANDRALGVLERFAVERDSSHLEGLWQPGLDPIRNDPRFKAVLAKMGLPYTPKDSIAP